MLIYAKPKVVDGNPPRYASESSWLTMTPSTMTAADILSDGDSATYVNSKIIPSVMFGMQSFETDGVFIGNRVKIQSSLVVATLYGYPRNPDESWEESALWQKKIETSTQQIAPVYRDRIAYARIESTTSANFKLTELVNEIQVVLFPTPAFSVVRSGSKYRAIYSAEFDNAEKFDTYNAEVEIKIFAPAQYSDADFNPEASNPVFSAKSTTLIDATKTVSLSCENSALLEELATYRAYYKTRIIASTESMSDTWKYIEFTTIETAKPTTPTAAVLQASKFAPRLSVAVDTSLMPSTLTLKTVSIEIARGSGSFEKFVSIELDASGNGNFEDVNFNPSVDNKYRFVSVGVDSDGFEYLSRYSDILTINASTSTFLASKNVTIENAFFTDAFESGTFEDDNTTLWAQGASAPLVMLGTKRLEKGSFSLYLSGDSIDFGDALIKDNGIVKMIDANGRYHKCVLTETKNKMLDVVGRKSILSATYQDVE